MLNYHQINPTEKNPLTVPTDDFAAQMAYLERNGYNTISPDQLHGFLVDGTPLPEKPILITFDDGYEDNYQYAYPILKEHNMKAAIFLVSDFMGRFDNYLVWDQVYEMSENNIYMGSHTLSHFELTPLDHGELVNQLTGGKLAVEWKTFKFCEYIAYPGGFYNQLVLSETKKAGYKGGFTVYNDYVRAGDDPYTMNRIAIFGSQHLVMPRFWIRLHMAPVVGRLERFRSRLIEAGYPTLAELVFIP
ncbi:polysaccharide deacetylase family protein [Anaerovibrio sp. JC8]|uniref:polysaccharide deacetylase family protein n=1 Tax=Anaerovibrio sp. JC8 TaxID=1240085 RepID=UPI0013020530|nr:polysaccharide deacetylase family protein [Anaerovibrio sp. JC8]